MRIHIHILLYYTYVLTRRPHARSRLQVKCNIKNVIILTSNELCAFFYAVFPRCKKKFMSVFKVHDHGLLFFRVSISFSLSLKIHLSD